MHTSIGKSLASTKYLWQILLFFLVLAVSTLDGDAPKTDDERILDIVKSARRGDDDSFTALYGLYYPPIYRHLYHMTGNEEDAADLAIETFTKAWYRLPQIQNEKYFRGWLYTIATNVALDHLRGKDTQKRGKQLVESFDESDAHEYTISFEEQVEEQELIRLTLAEIAPKPRACFLLYVDGFSQKEIAQIVGLKTKSVSVYISAAREKFRLVYNRLQAP